MTALPNPWLSDSEASSSLASDTAAVSLASAPLREAAADRRFILDERRFYEAIEPPPLFLQAAQ